MNLDSLTQVFRYYPQMSSILFILIIDGLCYGIHISEITHMIPIDTPINMMNLYAGYCNISLGCGASLGGYISGWFGDKMGSKKSGVLGLIFYILGCILATLTIILQNFVLTLVSAFFWGFFLFYI
jgi:MFS family permease